MTDPLLDTESMVIRDIRSRQMLGIAKYGVTLADNPLELKQWLQHQSYSQQLLALTSTFEVLQYARCTLQQKTRLVYLQSVELYR